MCAPVLFRAMRTVTRLKLAREARGLRSYEIAREVGITRSQFSLIEGGHVLPSSWLAERIAGIVGLAAEDLFRGGVTNEQEPGINSNPSRGCPRAADAPGLRAHRRRRSSKAEEGVGR